MYVQNNNKFISIHKPVDCTVSAIWAVSQQRPSVFVCILCMNESVLLCAASLLGPVWSHRQAYAVRPRPVGALHKVCEGTNRDRTELRQAAQVCLWFLWLCFWTFIYMCKLHFWSVHLCSCVYFRVTLLLFRCLTEIYQRNMPKEGARKSKTASEFPLFPWPFILHRTILIDRQC